MAPAGISDGPLSDQTLLDLAKLWRCIFDYLVLPHDIVAAPSWWVHADLFDRRAIEAMSY